MITGAELIKLNPEQLQEHATNLATLVQNISNEVTNLKLINNTAKQYWNQGVGTDVSSYGEQLEKNIKLINEKIIPSLQRYVQTMNVLADAVRDISSKGVSSSGAIAMTK